MPLLEPWQLSHPIERYFKTVRELALALEWTVAQASEWRRSGECEPVWLESMERLLELAAELDPLTGDPLVTGYWMLHPHHLLSDCGCDGLRVPLRPCHLLSKHYRPDVLEDIVRAAEDDFRAGSRRQRERMEADGYTIHDDGKLYGPQGSEIFPGQYPHFAVEDRVGTALSAQPAD